MLLTSEAESLARLFRAALGNDLPELPNWNVCPTVRVPVVTSEGGARRLRAMRWGLIPPWARSETDGPLLINARAETVAGKPAFREAVRHRRCLVPASGFYEWTRDAAGDRWPWLIAPREGAGYAAEGILALAGLWQDWASEGGELIATCAVVTAAAGPDTEAIHHRTPVLIAPQDWPLWLGEAGHGAAPLMRAAPRGTLDARRVGRAVNASRASGAELIRPLDGPDGGTADDDLVRKRAPDPQTIGGTSADPGP